MGRVKDAEAAYVDALAVQRPLAANFPTRPDYLTDLGRTHHSLGVLLLEAGRLTEAGKHHRRALPADDSPPASQISRKCGVDWRARIGSLAVVRLLRRDFGAAKAFVADAMPHDEAAFKANPRSLDYRRFYQGHLAALVRANAGLGDQAGATQTARKLRNLGWDPAGDAYNAACSLALCIPIVRDDDVATETEREKQLAFYAVEAMTMLRDAIAKGYRDAAHMDADNDLSSLRDRDDFKAVLAELKAKKK